MVHFEVDFAFSAVLPVGNRELSFASQTCASLELKRPSKESKKTKKKKADGTQVTYQVFINPLYVISRGVTSQQKDVVQSSHASLCELM